MARQFRKLRAGGQEAPAFTAYMAEALISGVDLFAGNVSGLCGEGGSCELDLDLARAAWFAHSDAVLDYAAAKRPLAKVWAIKQFELAKTEKEMK
ncbi:MAG: hypothetical protein WBX11_17740 [Thiobacillaceae bacterium]